MFSAVHGRQTVTCPVTHGKIVRRVANKSATSWQQVGNRLRNDLYCVGWGVKLYSIQFPVYGEAIRGKMSNGFLALVDELVPGDSISHYHQSLITCLKHGTSYKSS